MGKPNKHHFLPVFYLKAWARESDGKLVEFSRPYKDKLKTRFVHPEATGFIKRLYEIRGLSPELAQKVEETFFSPVDSQAADALKQILEFKAGDPWKAGRRLAWTRFILSLLFRMPDDIRKLKANVRDDWILSVPDMQERYAEVRRETDPESLVDFLDQQENSVYEQSAMDIAMRMIGHQNVARTILDMKWSLVELEKSPFQLLTSDRPVIMTEQLKRPDSHILLPVGPRHLFAAVQDPNHSRKLRRMTYQQLATFVNRAVVGNANDLVYGRDESQFRFIENRIGKDRRPSYLDRLQSRRRELVLRKSETTVGRIRTAPGLSETSK
ncbi:DUF4238 domain-containing protein [Mesorhizobium sp. LNHC209A00]|uniref:DUF4238 domain-containing protein n=1 Tax=Mesorhizobium TaxID=68287 RepID=UPI0003CFC54E|nr:DUF4238 domain-containing protein [Mesorhizobium sp. LNHC209A00]ESY98059.1 hypothetical protein X738_17580 [Mesorhizobium sp. LNHC209A00]